MAYVIFLAFELDAKKLKKVRNPKRYWVLQKVSDKESEITVSKLVGASLTKSRLVKRVWLGNHRAQGNGQSEQSSWLELGVEAMWLHRLRGVNSVVTLILRYPEGTLPPSGLQRLSTIKIRKILETVGLGSCLDTRTSVYSVVGSLAPIGDEWQPLTQDGWLHIQGSYMHEQILRHAVTQVAVERSILNSSLTHRRGFSRLFAPAVAARKVRQWPVEFLSDWESISTNYRALRTSLNLPAVRAEVLEQGKHWWTVSSVILAVIAVIIAVVF